MSVEKLILKKFNHEETEKTEGEKAQNQKH